MSPKVRWGSSAHHACNACWHSSTDAAGCSTARLPHHSKPGQDSKPRKGRNTISAEALLVDDQISAVPHYKHILDVLPALTACPTAAAGQAVLVGMCSSIARTPSAPNSQHMMVFSLHPPLLCSLAATQLSCILLLSICMAGPWHTHIFL